MADVTGTLGLFSLVDLFQLLESAARTGRLTVDHPEGSARVFFDEGRVVHAEFGELVGEEAVYALFADEQGSFEFKMGVSTSRCSIESRTENLVLEATRRLDEARRDGAATVDLDMIPGFADASASKGDLSLSKAEVALLRLVDGRRSVIDIAKASSGDAEEVRSRIQKLVQMGILKPAGRRPRTARLVTKIATQALPHGTAGVDPSIMKSWQKALGHTAVTVACRRPDGKVCVLAVTALPKAGPFLMIGRDTLMRADLAVNQPLLVRPMNSEAS